MQHTRVFSLWPFQPLRVAYNVSSHSRCLPGHLRNWMKYRIIDVHSSLLSQLVRHTDIIIHVQIEKYFCLVKQAKTEWTQRKSERGTTLNSMNFSCCCYSLACSCNGYTSDVFFMHCKPNTCCHITYLSLVLDYLFIFSASFHFHLREREIFYVFFFISSFVRCVTMWWIFDFFLLHLIERAQNRHCPSRNDVARATMNLTSFAHKSRQRLQSLVCGTSQGKKRCFCCL